MQRLRHPLDLQAVPKHRHEECQHYEECLEHASALLWPSFSCRECRSFVTKAERPYQSNGRCASPLAWDL